MFNFRPLPLTQSDAASVSAGERKDQVTQVNQCKRSGAGPAKAYPASSSPSPPPHDQ